MAFVILSIDTKEAKNLFDTIDKSSNSILANKNMTSSVSTFLKRKSIGAKAKTGNLIVNVKNSKSNPLIKPINDEIFKNNNLPINSGQILLNSESTQSFADLSQNPADFNNTSLLISKAKKRIQGSKTQFINDLIKTKELQTRLSMLTLPLLFPDGSNFLVTATNIKFSARDFNMKLTNVIIQDNNVIVKVQLSLSRNGLNKVIINLQRTLESNPDEVITIFRNKTKSELDFIGQIISLKPSSIRIGLNTLVNDVDINAVVENQNKSIVQTANESFNTLMTRLSDAELTRRVRASVTLKMPKGPPRGPPLSAQILTYRSGTFARSIDVFYDRKLNAVKYFYNPRYFSHESTSRDPRNTIEGSIRTVVGRLTGGQVRVFKSTF